MLLALETVVEFESTLFILYSPSSARFQGPDDSRARNLSLLLLLGSRFQRCSFLLPHLLLHRRGRPIAAIVLPSSFAASTGQQLRKGKLPPDRCQ